MRKSEISCRIGAEEGQLHGQARRKTRRRPRFHYGEDERGLQQSHDELEIHHDHAKRTRLWVLPAARTQKA